MNKLKSAMEELLFYHGLIEQDDMLYDSLSHFYAFIYHPFL